MRIVAEPEINVNRYVFFAIRASRDGQNMVVDVRGYEAILRHIIIVDGQLKASSKIIDHQITVIEHMTYLSATLAVGLVRMGFMLWKKW